MTDLTPLKRFIEKPSCDLGENAWKLADLVRTMRNARFMDLGVRSGPSSAVMSIEADERNNQVCGCDLGFTGFFRDAHHLVSDNYICYEYDSVTLGKVWDEDPFDIIFVDTEHTREQVLAELYFWSNHLKEGGYFVFHDSHWPVPGPVIGGRQHERVDVAITDFFGLPKSVREMTTYEDENISLQHYTPSYGMTFVQVKSLEGMQKVKQNIDWDQVFEARNWLAKIVLDPQNPDCISRDWGIDFSSLGAELVITP